MADSKPGTALEIPTDPSHYPIWADVGVRYSDMDVNAHVNNAMYPVYFEAGRAEFNAGPKAPPILPGTMNVVAQFTVRMIKSVTWPGTVKVGTRIAHLGNRSCVQQQIMFFHGECVATGEVIIVSASAETGKAIPFDDARKTYYEAHMNKPGPASL